MSDSVTNVQIEDVLSSIRKLVSEEVRAQARDGRKIEAAQAQETAREEARAAASGTDDRLLLTPALRVQPGSETTSSDEAPFTHAEDTNEEADLLDLMARVRAAGSKQAKIDAARPIGIAPVQRPPVPEPAVPVTEEAVRSALFALSGDEDALVTPSKAPAVAPEKETVDGGAAMGDEDSSLAEADDGLSYADHDDRITDADDVDEDDTTAEAEEAQTVPRFLHRSGITSLGQRIAEVESVVSTSGGEWEPEADEVSEASPGPLTSSVPWDDAAADRDLVQPEVADEVHEAEALEGDDSDLAGAHGEAVEAFSIEAEDAEAIEDALTPEVEASDDDVISVQAEADYPDDLAVALDDAEAEEFAAAAPDELSSLDEDVVDFPPQVDEPLEPHPYAANATQEPEDYARGHYAPDHYSDDRQTLAEEATILDEEMLRDLVAEIVRQELQGALGERITRNVRKLVRREIHRALTAQDLG
ncbi:hypothetical protein [Pseudooceanicola sp.]|uniref:hypothetical protein n=1 Tax=Pseudooceanicola sp. TaxID=1914328 RepID=UPI0035C6CECC